ncbi:MAG: peptide ABC transporter substrate-binding protein [Cellulosilyticum sp.]|nr:peptide ABC transporter substrate-binding protein [Cellulosilyticum sp.]
MKKKLILGLVAAMACSSFVGCGSSSSSTSTNTTNESNAQEGATTDSGATLAEEQTLKVNLGGDPKTLDPQLNSAADGSHVINNSFEGLLREVDGEIVPGVAESYTVSEDGLVYTFKLRESKWSDGQPVTAGDFEFAWKRGADPKTASEYMYIFESANILNAAEIARGEKAIDELGVKAIDDQTLEVTLTVPTDFFVQLCAYTSMMPVRADMVDDEGGWAKDPSKAISNGPFVLSEYKMGDQLIYVKNENYWDAENVTLEKIVYYMIVDESTAHTKYTAGELDINEFVPTDEMARLNAEDPTFYILPKLGTYYYAYNMNAPQLQDVRVRKALALAIDKDHIVKEVARGGEVAATGFMPTNVKDNQGKSFAEVAGDFGFTGKADVEQAKALLAEAGYPNGEGLGEIEILYNTSEKHKQIAEAVQEMLKQNLGVTVKLTNQEWAVFQETTNNNKFDTLARRGWIGDYNDPQTMLEIFESANGQNIGRYASETFDAEMAASRQTSGDERMEHLYNAYNILMEDLPMLPISYYTYPIMVQDTVEDWEITSVSKMWLGDVKMVEIEE